MKPRLTKILNTTLDVFGISNDDWELLKHTREHRAIRIVQAVSYIAYEYGFRTQIIAKFLDKTRGTIAYHIRETKDSITIYKDCKDTINLIKGMLQYEHEHETSGFLSRSQDGLLIMHPIEPERLGTFWVSVGSYVYQNQAAFPQITWETGPAKVKITVTLDNDEKM